MTKVPDKILKLLMQGLLIRLLVWGSVIAYFVEISLGGSDSYQSHPGFLWFERFVATVFTIEYLVRWKRNRHKGFWHYPTSALGIIDFIAIAPFWVGFFVPAAALGLVRTLRVLRLLKLIRYNRSLQLIALGFYRAGSQLKALCFAMLIVGLFSSAAIYQTEHDAQPDAFENMFSAFWFTAVTATTVGYGDISPITFAGKMVAMFTFVTALSIFAGIVGVLGNSFSSVLEEEKDPNVDPVKMFKQAKAAHKAVARLNNEYEEID